MLNFISVVCDLKRLGSMLFKIVLIVNFIVLVDCVFVSVGCIFIFGVVV